MIRNTLAVIVVAHVGQAFIGGLVAAAIGQSASMVVAMIVEVLSMLAGIANLMSMPLPSRRMTSPHRRRVPSGQLTAGS